MPGNHTHSRIRLSDTTADTPEHTSGSRRQTKRGGRVLFNFGRSKEQDGALGGSFDPGLPLAELVLK